MSAHRTDFSGDDDAIETEAIEWLCERQEGFAAGREREFEIWRAADPRHEAALARVECAMELISEMPTVRRELEERLGTEAIVAERPSPRGVRGLAWAAGMAAVFAIAVGYWWIQTGSTHQYVTAERCQQEIALKDGSVVNLNVNSDVRVRLSKSERRVMLATGEAYFEVAADRNRPFIVTTAGVSVRAKGTAFSVRVDNGDVHVLVTKGEVEVTRETTNEKSSPIRPPSLVAGEKIVIKDGDPAVYGKVERVSADALENAVRWHSQVMTFDGIPLRDVVILFNRRNTMQLVLGDAALGDRKIGGKFAASQVESFVRLLEVDGDVVSERRGSNEIVLRRAP